MVDVNFKQKYLHKVLVDRFVKFAIEKVGLN